MPSRSGKGQYYKTRTKKWLEAQGYAVGFLERVLANPFRKFVVKQDQFGADLLAVDHDVVLFVQVKHCGDARLLHLDGWLKPAREEFARFPCPPGAKQWIVVWPPRAREPRVVDCTPAWAHRA